MTQAYTPAARPRPALHRDVDEWAVRLVVKEGKAMRLGTAETWAAIDALDATGISAAKVARQVGCCLRTVQRRRRARREMEEK